MTNNETTPRNTDLTLPTAANDTAKAHAAIVALLERDGSTITGGCRAFYTPAEWQERGEEYGLDSALIVVHDGGDLARYCNMNYECYRTSEDAPKREWDRMIDALNAAGFWSEQCTSWYTAIYRSES